MMRIKIKTTLSLLTLLFTYNFAYSQSDLGAWYVYNGFYKVAPKWEVFFETQARTYEPIQNLQSFFARPFVTYNALPNFQVGLSQEYHLNNPYENDVNLSNTEEYRTTFQIISTQKMSTVNLQHRYRYELRVVDGEFKQRMRYRLQLGVPLNSKVIQQGSIFLTTGNEILIDVDPKFQLNQNRVYSMLGYQFTKSTNLQVGYMYISKYNHVNEQRLQFFLTQKLDFTRN